MSNEGDKEDPSEVESFIRTLLSTLEVFKSDSTLHIIKQEEVGESVPPADPAAAVQSIPAFVPSTPYTKSSIIPKNVKITSNSPLFQSAADIVEGEDNLSRPSSDQAEVEKFIRDMIENIVDGKEEMLQVASSDQARKRSDKEERESTHRFIRGLLENIDVYKEVMKKRAKEMGGEYYSDDFYLADYMKYLADRPEEEEEATFKVERQTVFRQVSERSVCFKCICMPNGDIYEGEYLQGKRHGRGLYCFKNGARYDGFWKRGLKHGKGQFLYPDGSRYIGYWKRDMKHGQGVYYYINGDTYDGGWYKGVRHGLGTYTYKNLNVTHYGTWKYGRMDGPGVLNYPCYKYHGNFERNLPKGPGCFVFDGKYMHHGFYVHEKDHTVVQEVDTEYAQTEGARDSYDQLYKDVSKGLLPIWKARQLTRYSADLLPPEPVPLAIKESQESMMDIIEYLQQQYAGGRPILGRPGAGRPCW